MGCSQSSFKHKKTHSKAKKTSISSTRRTFDGLFTSPTANFSKERDNDKPSGISKPEYGTIDELYPPLKALEKKPGTEETDGGHLPNGYPMDSRPRGPVFILNNFVGDAGSQCRRGSNLDVGRLDAAFKGLHFVVQPIERNLTAENMKTCCEDWAKLANRDFSKADCLVVIIMAHGIRFGHLLGVDCRKFVQLADLISPFHGDKSPTLIGKPKIFIVQACRGSEKCVAVRDPGAREMSTPPGYQREPSDEDICVAAVNNNERFEDNVNSGLLPRNADTLVAFSSSEGEKSFRSESDGSLYIRELTEVLKLTEAAGEKRRFLDIITEVQGRVSNLISEDENGERVVQMPEFRSTLRGPIYL